MKRSERAYLKLAAALPAPAATRLDLAWAPNLAAPALNGQRERQRIVRDLVAAIDFDQVVETGTFRGATTLFFSHLTGLPVYSVELLRRYHHYAQLRCGEQPGIHLSEGDSRPFLRGLAQSQAQGTTLFYLDAHWEDDVPRYEEVDIIASAWERAVVMIDDFKVPGDSGYGFTTYGETPLTVDYLPELPGWYKAFPAAPSAQETGAKRGCIVLASPSLKDAVADLPSLRPA